MLIRTVSVTFYLILCFTAISANMLIEVSNCNSTKVDGRRTCIYKAGDFLTFKCISNEVDANISITRYKDTLTIGAFEGLTHIDLLSVSQYFTEEQDGEKWNCAVQSSKRNQDMTFFFKLRNGTNQMGLRSAIDKIDYTVVWIAIGCCSLISLFAVISAVVAVKCITTDRKPVLRNSENPVGFSMYRKSSSGADGNDIYGDAYDSPYGETFSKGQMHNMYCNTSPPLDGM